MKKRTRKRITPEMIKKHFGADVGIERRLSGIFLVRTSTGELEIKQDGFRIHTGGEDVYRSITLLAGEAWGGLKANGPREHILACMAHGEVLGVDVTPDVKQKGGCCARICVTFLVAMIGWPASWIASLFWDETGKYAGLGITGLAIVVLWQLMARDQKEQERRQAQEMRFIYPVHHGTPRDASTDDLEEGGWL
jgi:hypothetical protein